MSHTDLFGRTTAFGLGTDGTWTYDWNGRDTSYANDFDSLFFVDGSAVFMPLGFQFDSYTINGAAPQPDGSASFDFYIPVLSDNTHFGPSIVLRLDSLGSPVTLAVEDAAVYDPTTYDPITNPAYRVGAAASDGLSWTTGAFSTVLVESGNTYTAKVGWESNGRTGYKLWKTSDPEPDDWLAVSITGETTSFSDDWVDFWYTSDDQDSSFDNLTIDDTAPALPSGQFALDAVLVDASTFTFCDGFSRSVSTGLGDGYVFVPSTAAGVVYKSTQNVESTDFHDDGSKVVATAEQQWVYRLPYPVATSGFLSFDFYVPATWNYTNSTPVWRAHADSYERVHGVAIYITATPSSSTDFFVSGNVYNGGSIHSWTPSATAAWFTAKTVFSDSDGLYEFLIKPQGADDSAAEYTESGLLATDNEGFTDEISVFPTSGTNDFLDNLCYTARPYAFTFDAFIIAAANPSFTLNAVLKGTQTHSFTLDAVITKTRKRNQHYRDRDHVGVELDSDVALTAAIGRYPAGTLVSVVLADLNARLLARPEAGKSYRSFAADAIIRRSHTGSFTLRSIIFKTGTQGPFQIDLHATIREIRTGSFTMDAVLV